MVTLIWLCFGSQSKAISLSCTSWHPVAVQLPLDAERPLPAFNDVLNKKKSRSLDESVLKAFISPNHEMKRTCSSSQKAVTEATRHPTTSSLCNDSKQTGWVRNKPDMPQGNATAHQDVSFSFNANLFTIPTLTLLKMFPDTENKSIFFWEKKRTAKEASTLEKQKKTYAEKIINLQI